MKQKNRTIYVYNIHATFVSYLLFSFKSELAVGDMLYTVLFHLCTYLISTLVYIHIIEVGYQEHHDFMLHSILKASVIIPSI